MFPNQVILPNQPSLVGAVQSAHPVGLPTQPIFFRGYPQFQNFHSSKVIYRQGLASGISPVLSLQAPQLAGPVLYQTILQRPQTIFNHYQNQQSLLAQQSNKQPVVANAQGPTLTNAALEPLRHSATHQQPVQLSQQQIYFTSVQATSENQSVRSIPTISQQQKSSYMFQDIKKDAVQVQQEVSQGQQIHQDNIQTQKLQKQIKQQIHKETIKQTTKASQYAQHIEKKVNIQKVSAQTNAQVIQKKPSNVQLATPVHSETASNASKTVSQTGFVSPLKVQTTNVQQIAAGNLQNRFVLVNSPKLTQSVATFASPQRTILANPISVLSPQSRIVLPVSSPQKIVQVLASPSRPKTQLVLSNSQVIASNQSLACFSRVLPQQTSRIVVSSPSARIVTQPVSYPLTIVSPVATNIGFVQPQTFGRLSQSVHIVQAHNYCQDSTVLIQTQASSSKHTASIDGQTINAQNMLGLEQKFLAFEEKRNQFDQRLQNIAINTVVDTHLQEQAQHEEEEKEIIQPEEPEQQNEEEDYQNEQEEDEDQNIVEENEQVMVEQEQDKHIIHGKITEEQSQEFKCRLEQKYEELHQDNNSTPLSQRSLETPPQTVAQQQQDIVNVNQESEEDMLHHKHITTTTTTTTTTTQDNAKKIHSKIFVCNTKMLNTEGTASTSVAVNQGSYSNATNQMTSLLEEQQSYLAQRSQANQVILNALQNGQIAGQNSAVSAEDYESQQGYAIAQQNYLQSLQVASTAGQQEEEEEDEESQENQQSSDILVQQQNYLQARGLANENILNQVLGITNQQQQVNLVDEQNNYLQARGTANELVLNQVLVNTESSHLQTSNIAAIQQQFLQARGEANENILNQIQQNQTEQQADLLEQQQSYLQARGQANEDILAFVQGGNLVAQNQQAIQTTSQTVEGHVLHHESSRTEQSATHTSETRASTTGASVVQAASSASTSSTSQTVVKSQTTTTTTTSSTIAQQSVSGAVQTSIQQTTGQ